MTDEFVVDRPGPMTTVQDRGRPGHAHQGVSPSGAADRPSYELANRLVGNAAGAAVLETTMTGPVLRYSGATVRFVALTGAPAALRVGGAPAPINAPVALRPGDVVAIGTAISGLRSYLAASGGIAVPQSLGSRSTDILGGLGPAPLRRGDRVPLGSAGAPAAVDHIPVSGIPDDPLLFVRSGPRAEWHDPRALVGPAWQVSDRSNRVGIRLTGPVLEWARDDELPSEGLICGAVQLPPNGQPVIFLADHPTTGGYPVIAVLTESSLPVAAQLRPGVHVRFAAV